MSAGNMEDLDEDLAVAQTQVNSICPLTQVSLTLQQIISRLVAVFII